jgi:hypothetical protein
MAGYLSRLTGWLGLLSGRNDQLALSRTIRIVWLTSVKRSQKSVNCEQCESELVERRHRRGHPLCTGGIQKCR